MQPRAAHQPRQQRGSHPGPPSRSLPSRSGTAHELRGEWPLLSPLYPAPGPLPGVGDPSPSPGASGAPWGRGGGGRWLLRLRVWRRSQLPGLPGRDPAPSTFQLPTQRRRRRRRTYRPERTPGADERAGRLAGGCARASVCVCPCVCLRECVCVCVTGTSPSSVRLRVRGRPSVGPSARRSVPRSVRAPSSDHLTKCASAAESRAQPPGRLLALSPGSAPPPGGLAPLLGNCAGPEGLASAGAGSSCGAQGPGGAGSRTLIPRPGSRAPPPRSSARSPLRRRPHAEVAWTRRAGEREHRIYFIHDFLLSGAPGPGCAATAAARGTPAGPCAPNPVQDRQADSWG